MRFVHYDYFEKNKKMMMMMMMILLFRPFWEQEYDSANNKYKYKRIFSTATQKYYNLINIC